MPKYLLKLSLAHRVNYLGGPQAKGGGDSILWSFKNINIFSKPKSKGSLASRKDHKPVT